MNNCFLEDRAYPRVVTKNNEFVFTLIITWDQAEHPRASRVSLTWQYCPQIQNYHGAWVILKLVHGPTAILLFRLLEVSGPEWDNAFGCLPALLSGNFSIWSLVAVLIKQALIRDISKVLGRVWGHVPRKRGKWSLLVDGTSFLQEYRALETSLVLTAAKRGAGGLQSITVVSGQKSLWDWSTWLYHIPTLFCYVTCPSAGTELLPWDWIDHTRDQELLCIPPTLVQSPAPHWGLVHLGLFLSTEPGSASKHCWVWPDVFPLQKNCCKPLSAICFSLTTAISHVNNKINDQSLLYKWGLISGQHRDTRNPIFTAQWDYKD